MDYNLTLKYIGGHKIVDYNVQMSKRYCFLVVYSVFYVICYYALLMVADKLMLYKL